MTKRINLKAIAQRARSLPAPYMMDLTPQTILALVAVVETARAHVNDPPLMTQHLSWHEKYNDLVSALQPFTVTE
jgi:hypothetical protein